MRRKILALIMFILLVLPAAFLAPWILILTMAYDMSVRLAKELVDLLGVKK